MKLRRSFVAEKQGDSAEILPELAFASDLNDVVFEKNPAVLRDEFEEVFFGLCRNGAVQTQIRTGRSPVQAVAVGNGGVGCATRTAEQLNQNVA